MKKQFTLAVAIAMAGIVKAQWSNGSGSNIFKTTTAGNVGIGLTSPAYKLDLSLGSAAANDGVHIMSNPSGGGGFGPTLFLDNQAGSGAVMWLLQSQNTGGGSNFILKTPTNDALRAYPGGQVYIGANSYNNANGRLNVYTTTDPFAINSKVVGSGLSGSKAYGITADASGAADNRGGSFTATGGWGIYAYASGGRGAWLEANDMGAGGITIGSDNYATGTGETIGVRGNVYGTSTTYANVGGSFQSLDGSNTKNVGCQGIAMGGSSYNVGVIGSANNTNPFNTPITFTTTIGTGVSIGVYGTAGLATGSYVHSATGVNWAGWFDNDVNINGAGYITGGVWSTSDRKFKKEIATIQNASAIIGQLNPTTYFFNTDNENGMNFSSKKQYGFISQEVEAILPDLVADVHKPKGIDAAGKEVTKEVDYKALNYIGFIALLTKGAQEQQQKINDMQQQINDLKALISSGNATNSTGIATSLPSTQLSDKNTIVLNQNVPNPFAESTVISYNIPVDFIKAQIVFTTANGQIIKTVDITTKGTGSLTVFGSDLSHGVYTYTLVVDGKTLDTKKMIKE